MANMIRVFECPNCERRTVSRLVNDVPHSFDEDCYECQHCGQIIRVLSQAGGAVVLGALAVGLAAKLFGSDN